MRGNCRIGWTVGALVGFAVRLGSAVLVMVSFLLGQTRSRGSIEQEVTAVTDPARQHRVRVRAEAVAGMSDEQLLLEWRVSYAALQLNWESNDIPAVVDFRQRCLDELERRHPRGFEQWLRSGPRASGDLTPFVRDFPGTG